MMRRMLLALGACAIVGLAACQTATPSQPAAPGGRYSPGFSEFRIDESHWRVTFKGNSLTSRETVEKYLLYRSAELTAQQVQTAFSEQPTPPTHGVPDSGPGYLGGIALFLLMIEARRRRSR